MKPVFIVFALLAVLAAAKGMTGRFDDPDSCYSITSKDACHASNHLKDGQAGNGRNVKCLWCISLSNQTQHSHPAHCAPLQAVKGGAYAAEQQLCTYRPRTYHLDGNYFYPDGKIPDKDIPQHHHHKKGDHSHDKKHHGHSHHHSDKDHNKVHHKGDEHHHEPGHHHKEKHRQSSRHHKNPFFNAKKHDWKPWWKKFVDEKQPKWGDKPQHEHGQGEGHDGGHAGGWHHGSEQQQGPQERHHDGGHAGGWHHGQKGGPREQHRPQKAQGEDHHGQHGGPREQHRPQHDSGHAGGWQHGGEHHDHDSGHAGGWQHGQQGGEGHDGGHDGGHAGGWHHGEESQDGGWQNGPAPHGPPKQGGAAPIPFPPAHGGPAPIPFPPAHGGPTPQGPSMQGPPHGGKWAGKGKGKGFPFPPQGQPQGPWGGKSGKSGKPSGGWEKPQQGGGWGEKQPHSEGRSFRGGAGPSRHLLADQSPEGLSLFKGALVVEDPYQTSALTNAVSSWPEGLQFLAGLAEGLLGLIPTKITMCIHDVDEVVQTIQEAFEDFHLSVSGIVSSLEDLFDAIKSFNDLLEDCGLQKVAEKIAAFIAKYTTPVVGWVEGAISAAFNAVDIYNDVDEAVHDGEGGDWFDCGKNIGDVISIVA